MGVLDSKEELLAELDSQYGDSQTKYYSCMDSESQAYTHYLAGEVLDCLYDTLVAIMYLRESVSYLSYQSDDNPYNADMIYFLDKFTGGVTWQQIVEAWVSNDFEGRLWTIGVIDRMRQILWDEPFDLTWAARPETREVT